MPAAFVPQFAEHGGGAIEGEHGGGSGAFDGSADWVGGRVDFAELGFSGVAAVKAEGGSGDFVGDDLFDKAYGG